MNGRSGLRAFIGSAVAVGLMTAGAALAQEFSSGVLVEKVVCQADPGQSYALYLPSAYQPSRKWPILVLFDPGARGALAVGAFQEAAETYGWVLAASNNSRNGPMRDSGLAARAIWVDILGRFPVDEKRVYAAGFSGGARVASIFPLVIEREIAGVIGCGAGLATGTKPGELKAAAYFGLAGLADFNYGEMKRLDLLFDPSGVPHRFLFFEGRHDWPEPSTCARAVGWLEVMAMKGGLRPADKALAEAIIGRELDDAGLFEAAGRVFWAVDRLEAAERLAAGLADAPGAADRVARLKAHRDFGRFLSAEKKRDKREETYQAGLGSAFGAVEDDASGGGAAVRAVLRHMEVGFLKKEAKTKASVEDRSLASRMLFEFSYAAQARAAELYGRHDLVRSAACFDLAIAACEEGLAREKSLYFNRACVAALAGEKARALDFLAAAVDKGLSDVDLLESTKDLDAVRDTDRFREILEKARKTEPTEKRSSH